MALGETLSFSRVKAARMDPKAMFAELRFAPRHLKVAEGIADGLSHKQIADRMGIVEGTAKVYCSELRHLTGLQSRVAIAQWVKSSRDAMEAVQLLRALEVPAA